MDLREIAKKIGVSHTTVSRALNPATQGLISEPVRLKIQAYADKVNYRPNQVARALARGKTHTIGVLVPTMFNSLFYNEHLVRTLEGVHNVLRKHPAYNCRIVFQTEEGALARLTQQELAFGLDGLFVSNGVTACHWEPGSKPRPHALKELIPGWSRPAVFVNPEGPGARKLSAVTFSHSEAAYQSVLHLIRKGHKSIALIYRDVDFEDSRGRFEGYHKALKDHGLKADAAWLKRGNYTRDSGDRMTIELMNGKKRPTAIFCTNDEMAMGALRALERLGLRCPGDVAVMGFDGLEAGNLVTPRLTSVRQPIQELTEMGMALLLDLIENRVQGPVRVNVGPQLVIRDSA